MSAPARVEMSQHRSLMNNIYTKQRFIYDASRKYYLLGRDKLIDELHPPEGGSVLEIGCGTGRNLTIAAQKHEQAKYYGIDISDEMLKSANNLVKKHHLGGKITLANADATNFDPVSLFNVEKFDRIFISYSLSMIPAWQDTLLQALKHLSDDGALHLVDFGQQSCLPLVFKKLLFSWLKIFQVEPRTDLKTFTKQIAEKNGRSCQHDELFRDYAQYCIVGPKLNNT